jgi:hypothetical protein
MNPLEGTTLRRPELNAWGATVESLIVMLHKVEEAAAAAQLARDQVKFGEARRRRSQLLALIDRAKAADMEAAGLVRPAICGRRW